MATVYGLKWALSGQEIIDHVRSRIEAYTNLDAERVKRREELSVSSRQDLPKNSPAAHLHGSFTLPNLPDVVRITDEAETISKFQLIERMTKSGHTYMLSLTDLRDLEWF